ncbi:MAG: hypothetical protein LBR73_01725 [Oscillospiraceae bacterium]|nr:hypothetical protein [Oscillospiraceae bacterium]
MKEATNFRLSVYQKAEAERTKIRRRRMAVINVVAPIIVVAIIAAGTAANKLHLFNPSVTQSTELTQVVTQQQPKAIGETPSIVYVHLKEEAVQKSAQNPPTTAIESVAQLEEFIKENEEILDIENTAELPGSSLEQLLTYYTEDFFQSHILTIAQLLPGIPNLYPEPSTLPAEGTTIPDGAATAVADITSAPPVTPGETVPNDPALWTTIPDGTADANVEANAAAFNPWNPADWLKNTNSIILALIPDTKG